MCFCAARTAWNVPFRCVSMTAFQSSSLILNSRLSRMIPAQVTRMSTEPPCSLRGVDRRFDVGERSSRRSAPRGRRSPPRSALRRPRRSRRRRPSLLPTRAAAPSRRRCPSRRPSPPPSCLRISSWRRRYTVRGMEFRDILRRRRMHRAFLPDPIPPRADRADRGRDPPRAVGRVQPGRQHRRRHRRGREARADRPLRDVGHATPTTRRS